MCVAAFYPAGVTPTRDELTNCTDTNPDGFGYALIDDGAVTIGRGMNPGDIIDAFLTARGKLPNTPALFHARIGTAGALDESNCHPFRLGNDLRTVIAHNGILPDICQPTKADSRSDTRLMADVWLPAFGGLASRRLRKRFGGWAGRNNKFVVLTTNPKYQKNAYIINESAGHWHNGAWYSNYSYEEPIYSRAVWGRSTSVWGKWGSKSHALTPMWSDDDCDDPTESTCMHCGADNIADMYVCHRCNACTACGKYTCGCATGGTCGCGTKIHRLDTECLYCAGNIGMDAIPMGWH